MEIRVLSPHDIPLMRAALHVFGDAFEDRETYCQAQPTDAYLADLLASPTFIAIAALAQQRVIGALAGYVLHKFERQRAEFYIYDLAVAADHRRRGVATSMIATLRHIAVRRGFHVIYVQADPQDTPAIALYSRLGIREDVLHFDIHPADDTP